MVEAGAAEAVAARYPWLGSPRENETWLSLLRFAEYAELAGLPSMMAAQDTTIIVDARGAVHVWGPVVDGESSAPTERDGEAPTELRNWESCGPSALDARSRRRRDGASTSPPGLGRHP